jgi:uncharacterized protein (DUF2132 family)
MPDESGRPEKQAGNPLHGVTLERILNELVEHYGWETLGRTVRIRCFTDDPSVASSLRFLRKTPWAREKVEGMYVAMERKRERSRLRAREQGGGTD